jgi:UDP-N-acetyl-D-glucosamine dehydrogenase
MGKSFKIGVIGLGYVGMPLVREFLNKNHIVIGFDNDKKKVDMLNSGKTYIKHINSDTIKKWNDSGRFSATEDFSRLVDVDYIIICVPTPLDLHKEPDLSYVVNTTREVAKRLRKGQLVILESTTYPGTTEEVMLPILEVNGLKAGKDFYLAYSPERENPGDEIYTTSKIPKVVGGYSKKCLQKALELYEKIVNVIPVDSVKIAEASKILENTFRAVNIAMVNELKMLFDRMDIDIWKVIEAAKSKPFGFMPFYPGPGLGGHCIPIDPFYLTWKAQAFDFKTRFIELAGEINTQQPYYVVSRLSEILNKHKKALNGSKILILGMAYKKNVDDTRESPSIKILHILKEKGAISDYYDPYIPSVKALRDYPDIDISSIKYSENKIKDYDAVLLLTNHDELPYSDIQKNAKIIVDTRNVYKEKYKNVYKA